MQKICKKIVSLLFFIVYSATAMEMDQNTIKLISKSGQEFTITRERIELSGTLRSLIESNSMLGQDELNKGFKFEQLSSKEIKEIIMYIKKLSWLKNPKLNGHIVFSDAKQKLKNYLSILSEQELSSLLKNADFLDIEPLLNVAAHFLALEFISLNILPDKFNEEIANLGITSPRIQEYITKHYDLKRMGLQEFSIRDYISISGQPSAFNRGYNYPHTITSLDGKELILNKELAEKIKINEGTLSKK